MISIDRSQSPACRLTASRLRIRSPKRALASRCGKRRRRLIAAEDAPVAAGQRPGSVTRPVAAPECAVRHEEDSGDGVHRPRPPCRIVEQRFEFDGPSGRAITYPRFTRSPVDAQNSDDVSGRGVGRWGQPGRWVSE
jgi:hypothetical protein